MSSKKRVSSFLKGAKKYRVDPGLTAQAIRKFLQAIDSPRSLAVWLLYENKEHAQLADLEINPSDYNVPSQFDDDYMATSLLSKHKDLGLSADREKAAYEKFEKFELLCCRTNARFRDLGADPLFNGPAVWLHPVVKRKISELLGEFTAEEFISMPDWGPGATTLIKRLEASSPIKFQREAGITRDLHSFISPWFSTAYPLWAGHLDTLGSYPEFQVGNKVITVAKTAAIDRVIAIEPGLNLWFQLSIGNMIRRRMLRAGINLRDQGRNQQLAKVGSVTSTLATVDLSSASDSISYAVAEELLPERWFRVMDVCRSSYGMLNGHQVRWKKFSSMGNGFTFPLESLIFYSIAKACCEYVGSEFNPGTYGDDVIVPTSAFSLFSTMMEFYGFVLNTKKSHVGSYFRESCGAHYFRGVDVKPIYLKGKLSNIFTVYRFCNAIRRLAHDRGQNLCCDARFRSVVNLLVSSVPKALRLKIPEGFGDVGFISNFHEASPRRCTGWVEGFQVPSLVSIRKDRWFDGLGFQLSSLWHLAKRSRAEEEDVDRAFNKGGAVRPSIPEAIRRLTQYETQAVEYNSIPSKGVLYRMAKGMVSQWPDLGPWLRLDQGRGRPA